MDTSNVSQDFLKGYRSGYDAGIQTGFAAGMREGKKKAVEEVFVVMEGIINPKEKINKKEGD